MARSSESIRVICGNSQYPSGGAGRRTGSSLLTPETRSPQVQKLDARRIVITSNPREHPMALIERDGKVYARKLWIFMGPNEWGNELMRQLAREAFATDASLDAVQVNEHAGWFLTFLRDGTIVGTANDQAHLDDKATEFLNRIYGYESAGEIRRP